MAGSDFDKNKRLEENMDQFLDDFVEESDAANVPKGSKDDDSKIIAKETDKKDETMTQNNEKEQVVNAFDIINKSKSVEDAEFKEVVTQNNEKEPESSDNIEKEKDTITTPPPFSPGGFFEDFDSSDSEATTLPEVIEETESVESDLIYTTYSIAKELDTTPQTIRNYADYFHDILSDEHGGRGQKIFNSQDLEILKKIQELRDKKYSRSQIRNIFKEKGISSNKIVNRDTNINGPSSSQGNPNAPAAITPQMMQSLTQELQGYITNGLEDIRANFLQNLKTFTDSLENTVKEQQQLIADQKKEIDELKSVVGNINRTTRNTDKLVTGMAESINDGTKKELSELKNSIVDKLGQIDSKDTAKELSDIKSAIIADNSKTTKTIMESVVNTDAKIQKVQENINKLAQSNSNNSQNNNNLRKDLSQDIAKGYSNIQKSLKQSNEEKYARLEEQLTLISESLKNNTSVDPQQLENALKQVEDLNIKYSEAEETINNLENKNIELIQKFTVAGSLLTQKDKEINELKDKITAIMTATMKARQK